MKQRATPGAKQGSHRASFGGLIDTSVAISEQHYAYFWILHALIAVEIAKRPMPQPPRDAERAGRSRL
jgi:hypothetical protein